MTTTSPNNNAIHSMNNNNSNAGGSKSYQHHNHNRKRYNNNHHNNNRKRQRRRPPPAQAVEPKPAGCSVCNDENKKANYKCPKCRALYCSVACCKVHKESCPQVPPTNTNAVTPSESAGTTTKDHSPYEKILLSLQPKRSFCHKHQHHNDEDEDDDDDDDDPNWNINDTMKKAMQKSKWLHEQLQDGGLRDVVTRIVQSKNPDNLQLVTTHYPEFACFIDKLKVLTGVLERDDGDSDDETTKETPMPMEEWLQQPFMESQRLTLKPIPRRTMPVFEPVDDASSSASSGSDIEERDSSSSVEESSDDSSSDAVESSDAD